MLALLLHENRVPRPSSTQHWPPASAHGGGEGGGAEGGGGDGGGGEGGGAGGGGDGGAIGGEGGW